MTWPRTLRGKLAWSYALALLIALVLVATVTVVLVDRAQRETLDDRLGMASRTLGALTDIHHNAIALDADDRAQFVEIVGPHVSWAVLGLDGHLIGGTVTHISPAIVAIATGDAVGLHDGGGDLHAQRISASYVPLGGHPLGFAIAWDDLAPIVALDRRVALAFALSIPLLAAFAVIGGTLVASRGLRPLQTLATLASEIAEHDLSRRLGAAPTDDELGHLCATFDLMLDRLEAAFERQGRFTSDASHELRAPLAVIRAEADLMLRRPRVPAEYQRALREIAVHADELEALTRDLLASARSDAGLDLQLHQPCNAETIVADAIRRLEPLAAERRIAIEAGLQTSAYVSAHEPSLRRAIGCVLHNAVKFARPGGVVGVSVHRDARTVTITVTDDGAGFSAAALVHGTDRFWRDDHLRARAADGKSTGSGLGLSIAATAVSNVGGSLTLHNRTAGGAEVRIALPAAPETLEAT